MKKHYRQASLLVPALAVIFSLTFAHAQAASLVWDPSTGLVDGYKVYYSTNPSDQTTFRDVGNTTQLNIDSLPLSEGLTYYFSVSAYNSAGESQPCSPVIFTPGDNTPPAPPIGLTPE